jgi:hypothetical protein
LDEPTVGEEHKKRLLQLVVPNAAASSIGIYQLVCCAQLLYRQLQLVRY